jgi:Leucine-rich repeat (LRR) protein
MVVELSFSSVGVKNLWPLCALKHLRVLHCAGDGTNKHPSELANLSPLAELTELEELDCSWTSVEDLSPLANLPLKSLHCANTRVHNLAPLQNVALVELDVTGTPVADLTPLKGKPLALIRINQTRVHDLSALHNAPIKDIWCDVRLLRAHPEVAQSWTKLESVNDAPTREIIRRAAPPKLGK